VYSAKDAEGNWQVGAMSADVIFEVEVLDETIAGRRALAQSSIEQYGGRYLVTGAVPDVPEGEWLPEKRLVVVVEFPSVDAVRRWYGSRNTPKHSAFDTSR
jgi:uncharacterized protein (DUF1330 family)